MSRPLLLLALFASLAGCDQLGLESASVAAARVEADGKAVGAACRHGGRAIEDCFTLNRKTDKAAIYTGWREMDDYMRQNKIEAVPAVLPPPGPAKPKPAEGEDAAASADAEAAADAKGDAKPERGDKGADKGADKPASRIAPKPARAEAKPDKADKPAEGR